MEYPKLEEVHGDHPIQTLAPHGTMQALRAMTKRSLSSSSFGAVPAALGGWEGCSVPTALRSLIGVSEGRSGGAAPCAGLRARCCRAGRGRGGGGELEGRRCEPLVPRPINTVLRSVPCPRAPRGGAGWSGAERSGAGGAERERTGSDGGAEVGPGAAGVRGRERAASGGGAAPNLPPPARSPVMGPRDQGLPVPRTPTAGPCAPPRSSCPPPPKAAAFPSFLRPASAPCARTPRRPPAAPAAPRGPPTPASAPFLPKGRTLPRPASEGRGAEEGGGGS